MVKMLVLVSLVAAVAAQEAPKTPLWFLETSLTGAFSERSNQCKTLLGDNKDVASFGPIFIPGNSAADICIRFPARDTLPETWRHDRGQKGACANGCCEFLPPLKNPPPPAPQPTWFTTESGCSDTSAAITAPTLFQGQVSLLLQHFYNLVSTIQKKVFNIILFPRNWTQRKFASNSRMEVLSTEREF